VVFKTDYWAVVDALKAKLEELKTAGVLKNVVLGEERLENAYPVAFILPKPYVVKEGVPGLEEHPIAVDVLAVHWDYSFEAGLKKAVDAAADCRDKLYEDRTLGKTCNDLFVKSFGPSVEKQKDAKGSKKFHFTSMLDTVCVRLFVEV